ncbi:selenocysteine-specific translation elongation factor [Corynebacterium sp. CNCTC7651]|uniref:selenocysteine-specific translation elongation factor n=1 Tax=Corynebacterium sp. CNCTC7651 TaxID=2815361 RepID=UPI001F3C5301|nr:selenocysteine-specific translation elongation factor [Corynebacterium sp. CNCTC7651]UIZ92875.1 selenocysteine-specific translation elongation factor [Corynebacterium sp. CNCTC7651]
MSYVVATAGHVDHGKSTLVKRLTGMEPDRWEEERQRGLTIDLGFVWADIDGQDVAFVDVPGHERFIANMLAGVGPAPAVMLVVAADEGVMAQTVEHMAAIDGFGIRTGVIAVTRADRAEGERRQTTRAQIADAVARTTLQDWPVVEVSAVTGEGLDELRTALAEVLRAAPAPDAGARVRFWVDRSFTVKGAGTVVTGTLTAGTIRPGDTLALRGEEVQVRSVQSEDAPIDTATPARRVALNLRGVDAERVGRGDALTTPGAWHRTALVDVVLAVSPPEGGTCEELPREAVAHIGTAGVGCRVRSLGPAFARLTLEEPLPLTLGDTIVLRGTGGQRILAGLTAIDVDPEPFTRRGDAARRAEELDPDPDVSREIARRVAVTPAHLARLGFEVGDTPPAGSIAFAGYWIRAEQVMSWKEQLIAAVAEYEQANPLGAGLSVGAGVEKLGLPDAKLLPLAAAAAKLTVRGGVISSGRDLDLGPGIAKLEAHLERDPFAAPEARDLEAWHVGAKELAAAERAGRVIRIADGVVLLPDAPARAAALLRGIEQPFTASDARKAWGTTRRVAIPLLELLDAQGKTRRVAGTQRVVV